MDALATARLSWTPDSALPAHLVTTIAPPAPALRRTVRWTDLIDGQPLPDGDRIVLTEARGVLPAHRIGIALELGPGLTLWKGLQAGEILLAQCEGTLSHSAAQLGRQVLLTRPLTLWKAGATGLHRAVYTLEASGARLCGGSALVFRWLAD
jgi:hypothetical protein